MKRSIFAIFAALTLLVAAPMVAQQEDAAPEPYESRTNPDADNISGDSGLTITGTIVEWNDEQLVIRTTTGVEHIQIVPGTDRPVELTAGESVSVDYTRTTQGVMIAQEIRPHGAVEATSSAASADARSPQEPMTADVEAEGDVDTELDVETDAEATAEEDFDADASLDATADVDTGVEADLDTQADLDTEAELDTTMDDEDTLPATGSSLPLLALLGLLSVAAAFGVRSLTR